MAYKMKNSPLTGRGDKKNATEVRNQGVTNLQTWIDENPNATKDEVRYKVKAYNDRNSGNRYQKGTGGNAKIKVEGMWKYMRKHQPEATTVKVEEPLTTEIPSTYGESRQDFVQTQLNPEAGSAASIPLSEKRKMQRDKDIESGYSGKLTDALMKKYGKQPHELEGQDLIDAETAMIDKDGKILPMSSSVGPRQSTLDETSPTPRKSPRGFKMKGMSFGGKR